MKKAQLAPTPMPTPNSVPLSGSEDPVDAEEDVASIMDEGVAVVVSFFGIILK